MSETSDCIVFSDAAIKRGDHIIWQHGTFAIPTGSVTAIVGTNGTGKTTMMRAGTVCPNCPAVCASVWPSPRRWCATHNC